MVDAAVALQSQGHTVTMYTSHHDRAHCFEETRDGMRFSLNTGNDQKKEEGDIVMIFSRFSLTYLSNLASLI